MTAKGAEQNSSYESGMNWLIDDLMPYDSNSFHTCLSDDLMPLDYNSFSGLQVGSKNPEHEVAIM